jgi:hypothetical protein
MPMQFIRVLSLVVLEIASVASVSLMESEIMSGLSVSQQTSDRF